MTFRGKSLRTDADAMAAMIRTIKGPAPLHDPMEKDPDPKNANLTNMLHELRGE